MRDVHDNSTLEIDAIALTKKRGRPASSKAMSDAQRKRLQRMRDQHATTDAIGCEAEATTKALLMLLNKLNGKEINEHGLNSARRAWEEIGRRFNFVTVTNKEE